MIQSIDSMKPVYNAVNINIRKPVVDINNKDRAENPLAINDDYGIYNAVKIEIDRPRVQSGHRRIYDYPQAQKMVTYEMANIQPFELPQGFPVTNYSAVILSKENKPVVPEPNFTTLEAEKGLGVNDNDSSAVSFHGAEDTKEIKKPEIIPSEEIKPAVDIQLVVENLTSDNFDKQAQQMEEIARISIEDESKVIPYIVSDVFTSLIDITKKDISNLAAPTEKQIEARKKLIANLITAETNPQAKQPYQLSEEEIALANTISPMEQAERNKEYALVTIAVLAKTYIKEVQKETGNVVPMTDVPGMSAIVDALRHNPNPEVKVASLDALRHIQIPEYRDELATLYTLAATDRNPIVSKTAIQALQSLNELN